MKTKDLDLGEEALDPALKDGPCVVALNLSDLSITLRDNGKNAGMALLLGGLASALIVAGFSVPMFSDRHWGQDMIPFGLGAGFGAVAFIFTLIYAGRLLPPRRRARRAISPAE